ncbi:Piwi-domain-containing protein [Linnemannia elongata AG-77]|uniref:Piwi-domain-containing protein n=1 Tax=Linnemannia elongata AG-77 TaxID=1314771 RepID=A0A197JTF6_9FUNG|nr:Piwi-domain-containing protein [Linnemannia elongata AG-77]
MAAKRPAPIALTENALRPDKGGSTGRSINVRTNFFAIKKLQVDTIYHYDVTITPEIPAEKARQLWKIIESTFPELAKNKTVFDGKCNAYAAQEMTVEKLTRKVELPDGGPAPAPAAAPTKQGGQGGAKGGAKGGKGGKGGAKGGAAPGTAPAPAPAPQTSGTPPKKKNEFTVKIARANVIELEELHRFLRREGPITSGCLTAIQALNIVMSHKLFSEMVSVGRSAFTPNNAQNLGGGVEKWDGIFQSVRPGQGKLYANIDVANTAFIKGGNAAELVAEIKNVRSIDDFRGARKLQKRDIQELSKHFKGCSFTVNHRGGDFKKKFKVSEISQQGAEGITFAQELNNGTTKKVTIPQYYAAAYNLKLRFPFLPCIGVKGRDNQTMYFPLEVCNVVSGRRYTKRLNELQTAEMIKGTCITPDQRAAKIQASFPVLDFEHNEYLKGFQMEISKEMQVVPARVLPPPQVEYRNNVSLTPQFGGWQLNPSRKMVQGATLSSWGVLIFENENRLRRPEVDNFIRELVGTLAENGMNVTTRSPPVMYAQPGNVERNVDSMWTTIGQACNASPQMILVVLPSVCQTYSVIKTYCETTHKTGVMTQCVLSKKVSRPSKQYCGMLGLKINSKLGGINNTLSKTSIPFLNQAPTMIIGADVTHPAPGESRPSVVAVVGSMDQFAFKYSGRIKVQASGAEVIDSLKFLVYQLLVAFSEKNKTFPKRILFYRDGVSEGQYADVMKTEVSAVKEAVDHVNTTVKFNQPYKPTLTFCVVKKRHHARLFPMNPKEADKSGNCVAGTVVDTVITHPTEFDFYLQSHGGLQGTSRPTLYHVLMDENKFTSDALQSLTYRLCHVYARCPKSVSIVPAVYYAHLLAYRARHYQGGDFSDTASSISGSDAGNAPTFTTSTALKNLMYFV